MARPGTRPHPSRTGGSDIHGRPGPGSGGGRGRPCRPSPSCLPFRGPPQLSSQDVLTDRRVDAANLLGGQLQPEAPAWRVGGGEDGAHHGLVEPSQGGQMPDAGHQLLCLGNRQVGRVGGRQPWHWPPGTVSTPHAPRARSLPCLRGRGPVPAVLGAADSPRSARRAGRPASHQAAQGLEEAGERGSRGSCPPTLEG